MSNNEQVMNATTVEVEAPPEVEASESSGLTEESLFDSCNCWASLQQLEDADIERTDQESPQLTCPSSQRFPRWREEVTAPERVGLALSGGGIRSATFNLGVLQELDKLKILSGVDYVSTVSGGGYVGGFWSAWLKRRKREEEREIGPGRRNEDGEKKEDEEPAPMFPSGEPEAEEIRHLREFANFLRPRMSLFTFSTGRIVAGAFGAVVPSVVIALAVLVFVLAAWAVLSQYLSGAGWGPPGLANAGWMLGISATLVLVGEALWWRRPEAEASRANGAYLAWSLFAVVLTVTAWWFLWHLVPLPSWMLLRSLPPDAALTAGGLVALPAGAWLVTALVLAVFQTFLSRLAAQGERDPQPARARQAALGRVLSLTLLGAATWLVVGGCWLGGQWLAAVGVEGIVGAVATALGGGGTFAFARRLFSAQPNKPSGARWRALLRPWLPRLIASITILASATSSAALLVLLAESLAWSHLLWPLLVAALLLAVAAVVFDPHETGFHALYRGRLTRSYLGASNRTAPPFATEVAPGDDLGVDQLPKRPLHLICCTANDLASDELPTLHRGAQSAVISRNGLQVGDRWRRWSETGKKGGRAPSLAGAMTASAAAFNSLMGSVSMRIGRPSTFLLAALGLRLGLWIEGPSGAGRAWTSIQRKFPGLLFLRELFGWSTARSGWVHLSDGAHFENLALYELIRRHCRYILLSDCGADPDVAFDDFGNVVRRVREDFGVEIDIDLEPLRSAVGSARQPMVAGTIEYPRGDQGILLYLKPTLVGEEPSDISQYAIRNEAFPHETTLDQFYDEAQWEAYRQLGQHITGKALAGLQPKGKPKVHDRRHLIRVFLEARLAWPPTRGDDAPTLTDLEREWETMEAQLVAKGPRELYRQVLGCTPPRCSPPASLDLVLFEALPIIQCALRLMHTLCVRSGMNDSSVAASHPRYKGWFNRLGRWATSQLFRAWWPWLSPLYPRSFKLFMHAEFQLPLRFEVTAAKLQRIRDPDGVGYTLERWRARRREWSSNDGYLLGLTLPLGPDAQRILAGVVEVRIEAKVGWVDSDRLYVGAGLWGVGVGELFVERLIKEFSESRLAGLLRHSTEIHELRIRAYNLGTVTSALWAGGGFKRQAAPECPEAARRSDGTKPKAEFVLSLKDAKA